MEHLKGVLLEHLKGVLLGQAPVLPTNTIQSYKVGPGANTLAYYDNSLLTAVKSFITFALGSTLVRLSTKILGYGENGRQGTKYLVINYWCQKICSTGQEVFI